MLFSNPLKKKLSVAAILAVCAIYLFSQQCVLSEKHQAIVKEENVISGPDSSLVDFYEKLYRLKNDSATNDVISILHIGDSHLQADFISAQIRKNLQADFGNAGRGLIAPLKLAKTNEPFDYQFTSENNWISSSCMREKPDYPPGITGITIASSDSLIQIQVALLRENNSFRKLTIFHSPDSLFKLHCQYDSILYLKDRTTVFLPDTSRLEMEITHDSRLPVQIQGVVLETADKGILYHASGINGAHFLNYADKGLFLSQTTMLHPSLIIVSLGTNEAYRRNFSESLLYKEIDQLINALKEANPNACFLLTTPAAGMRKTEGKLIPNKQVYEAGCVIKKYAEEHNLACWDISTISGGKQASSNWMKNGWLAKDGIHFTKQGYIIQGDLLYQALINEYNRFVSNRLE